MTVYYQLNRTTGHHNTPILRMYKNGHYYMFSHIVKNNEIVWDKDYVMAHLNNPDNDYLYCHLNLSFDVLGGNIVKDIIQSEIYRKLLNV